MEVLVNGRSAGLNAGALDGAPGRLSSARPERIEVGTNPGLRRSDVPLDAIGGLSTACDPAAQTVSVTPPSGALLPRRLGPPRARARSTRPRLGGPG